MIKKPVVKDNVVEVKATLRYLRTSPYKVQRILDQIRGRSYAEALMILMMLPYRASRLVLKLLLSAIANAKNRLNLNDPTQLIVNKTYVDQAPDFKRFRARARGRGYPIQKPSCHITIILECTK
uniref:Large ribosomal subunit protein uL22c n=1 Tax=Glaucocystis incrassata TaxID=1789788 RepID=A0A3G1IVI9_9EUKA|nr:ribosomal protein L22 [Glaucocystis incrassata]ASQ40052.1 ribosomal protein L22 [Glaucocystis incrassata]